MLDSKTDCGISVKPVVPVYIVQQQDDILAKSVFGE
jgi:hypothetical protein